MGKIAVGAAGDHGRGGCYPPVTRWLARGLDWSLADVVCGAGPQDAPFEEQHNATAVAIVLDGTFQYRSSTGRALMTPGSLLLGNAGDTFCCAHEHGTGDRCVSFWFSPALLEQAAAGCSVRAPRFRSPRLPPLRETAGLVAGAAALLNRTAVDGEELSICVAAGAIRAAAGLEWRSEAVDAATLSRVTRVVRAIAHEPALPQNLAELSAMAGLSRFHFIRAFDRVTGSTPHQYIVRCRLRRAALSLASSDQRIVDVAFGCGFDDLSHFTRTFRREFGVSPRAYRSEAQRSSAPTRPSSA